MEAQTLYYIVGALVAAAALIKSFTNGVIHRFMAAMDRVESTENKVDDIQSSIEEIREQQESMDRRQERLVTAVVAATKNPDRVDPDLIEQELTKYDDSPSPADFYGDAPFDTPGSRGFGQPGSDGSGDDD